MNEKTEHRPHLRTDLDFVSADDHGVLTYWPIAPSGDPSQHYPTGYRRGRDALTFAESREDGTDLLICIFRDIAKTGSVGPLEIGYFDAVSVSAVLHQNSLRTGHIEKARPAVLQMATTDPHLKRS